MGDSKRERRPSDHVRGGADCKNATPAPGAVGPVRGVLRAPPGDGRFEHRRWPPAPAYAGAVEHCWSVRWDLAGAPPVVRETLPHPCVHIVVEDALGLVHGVQSGRFTRTLSGRGSVFGIKFRPGAFRPHAAGPVSALRDRQVPLEQLFGAAGMAFAAGVHAAGDDDALLQAVARLFECSPVAPDPLAEEAAVIVAAIAAEPGLTTVQAVAARHGCTPRALQRLFRDYVGIGPKWVIARYRLHEVLARLDAGTPVDFAALAMDLGYFDQAHFIRDFRRLVGCAPGQYAR